MTVKYERNDGKIDTYTGTGSFSIIEGGISTLNIILSQQTSGGTGIINGQNERYFYITLTEKFRGYLITGATINFLLSGDVVRSYTITEENQQVYLLVQKEQLAQITEAYAYEISHPNYLLLNGNIKISMNDILVDGEIMDPNTPNFQKYMVDDTTAPVINSANFPINRNDSQGDFGAIFNVTDNRVMASVILTFNGHAINGVATATGDYNFATIPLAWLNYGANTLTITAKDSFGNTTTQTYSITREDDILPNINVNVVVVNGTQTWTNPYIFDIVQFQLEFGAADNHQIASVKATWGVQNMGNNVYRANLYNGAPGTYTCVITIKDTSGNTRILNYVYTVEHFEPPVIPPVMP